MRRLALLLSLALLWAITNCEVLVGFEGETITIPTKANNGSTESLVTKNGDKVVEWERGKEPVCFQACDRINLWENGSLTIHNLVKNDSGSYVVLNRVSGKDVRLEYQLTVYDPLRGPNISCNAIDGGLALNCTADFQKPLDCFWDVGGKQPSCRDPLFIPSEDVKNIHNVTCIIKSPQMESRSTMDLNQCIPEEKAVGSAVPTAIGIVVVLVLIGIFLFLKWKGKIPFGTRRQTAQNNNAVEGSEELTQFVSGSSQQQPGSEGETAEVETMDESESEERRRIDTAFRYEDDGALKDKEIVKNGVIQEGTLEKNSILLANHAGDHGTDN